MIISGCGIFSQRIGHAVVKETDFCNDVGISADAAPAVVIYNFFIKSCIHYLSSFHINSGDSNDDVAVKEDTNTVADACLSSYYYHISSSPSSCVTEI